MIAACIWWLSMPHRLPKEAGLPQIGGLARPVLGDKHVSGLVAGILHIHCWLCGMWSAWMCERACKMARQNSIAKTCQRRESMERQDFAQTKWRNKYDFISNHSTTQRSPVP